MDYGSRTVGIAVSDPLGLTAQGLETVTRKAENKLRRTCARIEELVRGYGASLIVLGYPLNMNDTEGERVEKVKEFKEMLERRTLLPVFLMDERLTTVEADRILSETGVAHSARKAQIDKMAAAIILQTWLDLEHNKNKN